MTNQQRLEAAEAEVKAARAALALADENYQRDNAAWMACLQASSEADMLLLRAATRSGIARNIARLDLERAELGERMARLHIDLEAV